MKNLLEPVKAVQIVDVGKLKANDYNPNKVLERNLKLLEQSILANGWTLPIVCRPDFTIIDGFHRWMVAQREPLKTELKGKVPVVIVDHPERKDDIVGTITHNRARGTHLLEPMKKIVQELMGAGESVEAVAKQLGMSKEEVFRLSDMRKDDFLRLMAEGHEYSKAQLQRKV